MHSEPLHLSHQSLLIEKFKRLNLNLSEYCFSNLYLFRKIHQCEVVQNKHLFIKGFTYNKYSVLIPTDPIVEYGEEELVSLLKSVDFLYPIPEHWLPFFDPLLFTSTFLDEDSDYLFLKEKMKIYPGRYLDKKRNLVKQFLSSYQSQSQFYPLNENHLGSALQILEGWQNEQEISSEKNDYFPCREGLMLMKELNLSGFILYVAEKPIAFSLGETFHQNSYLLHFAKALKSFKGVYPYFYQLMAEAIDPSIQFLNFEQDLGIASLRQSKRAYRPDYMARKFRISLKLPTA